MSEKHVPGLLQFCIEIFDNDGCPETAIQAMGGAATVAVALDFGANNPRMREANARRIVACWNACDGVPTEDLEHYYGSKGGLDAALEEASLRDHTTAIEQRDALLAFAEEVRRTGDTRLASMAIAVIAKATGGAT